MAGRHGSESTASVAPLVLVHWSLLQLLSTTQRPDTQEVRPGYSFADIAGVGELYQSTHNCAFMFSIHKF